jgi:N-acylglucosamine-6-phosphate 2-epimerase
MIFPRGLIVSSQAYEGDPMFGPNIVASMARAAEKGGAVAIRANSPEDIQAIREVTSIPIIGIYKVYSPGSDVYITPDYESAEKISVAGCDIVAIDATKRKRPKEIKLIDLVNFIKNDLKKAIMADISCVEEALYAESLGADIISSTLSGYTSTGRPSMNGPDLELITDLVKRIKAPIVAEGRFHTPDQAVQAILLGAHAVAIGESITRPEKITERFVEAINR